MTMFRTLDELHPGRRVLVRVDLNSPVEAGVVQDNKRFERHAETLRELVDDDHRVTVLAHQGRPGRETFISLERHADILADHLGEPVRFVDDTIGDRALAAIDDLEPGEVLLLENVRMLEDELADRTPEEHARSEFVRTLAPAFDAFVNDAYSTAHRSHASTVGFAVALEAYAGRVMESEYVANTAIQSRSFDGPVTMVLGGTKVSDLIAVLDRVEDRVDRVCLGGVIGELFLRASTHEVGFDVEGTHLFDEQWERNREAIRALLEGPAMELFLPSDLAFDDGGQRRETAVEGVHKEVPFLDVGSTTIEEFADVVEDSAAVFVKGSLGQFEDERFSVGTVELLRTIASADAFSVIGGGDTAWAIDRYGLDEDAFSHVSIAGGAYVRALAGETLPAIEALRRSARA